MAKRKSKVPKAILGISIPKQLRHSRSLETLLGSPLAREILADVLLAAAGAAAAALSRHRPRTADTLPADNRVTDADGTGVGRSRDALQSAGGTIGAVLSEVATTILPGQDKARGKGRGAKGRKRDKADREGQQVRH